MDFWEDYVMTVKQSLALQVVTLSLCIENLDVKRCCQMLSIFI